MNAASQTFWAMIQYRIIRNQPVSAELVTNFKGSFRDTVSSSRLITLLGYQLKFDSNLEVAGTNQLETNIQTLLTTINPSFTEEEIDFYTNCFKARYYFSLGMYEALITVIPAIMNYKCDPNTDEWFLQGGVLFNLITVMSTPQGIQVLKESGFTDNMLESILAYGELNAIPHRDYNLMVATLN